MAYAAIASQFVLFLGGMSSILMLHGHLVHDGSVAGTSMPS